MSRQIKIAATACAVLFAQTNIANATLIDRGSGLIYDSELNVTWMQDAQYALTSGVSDSGKLDWQTAIDWAANLSYYDSARDTYWDGWRLPSTVNSPSSLGYDVTGLSSELAFMYYINLGYAPNYSHDRWDPAPSSDNYNPFLNLQSRGYWSGTESDFEGRSWMLHFHFGSQEITSGYGDPQLVWLLRDGDVATSVPEPAGAALMGIALISLHCVRRRRRWLVSN